MLIPVLLSAVFMLTVTYAPGAYIIGRDAREFGKAAVLLDRGDYQQAETIFKRYKSKYPEDTGASYNLALIYVQTERIPLAKQELSGLLRTEPDNKDARELLRKIASF